MSYFRSFFDEVCNRQIFCFDIYVVTLSLIRATPFQLFTFCLLIHLNTERESIEKNVGSVANKRMLVRIWNIANVGGVLLTTSILHLVGMSCI